MNKEKTIDMLIRALQEIWKEMETDASLSIIIEKDYFSYHALDSSDAYVIKHSEFTEEDE